jgi:hypothetical protein
MPTHQRTPAESSPSNGLRRVAPRRRSWSPHGRLLRAGSLAKTEFVERHAGSLSRMRGRETRQDKVTWLNRRRSLGADPTARQ